MGTLYVGTSSSGFRGVLGFGLTGALVEGFIFKLPEWGSIVNNMVWYPYFGNLELKPLTRTQQGGSLGFRECLTFAKFKLGFS